MSIRLLLFSFCFAVVFSSQFHEECAATLRRGRSTVAAVARGLAEAEKHRAHNALKQKTALLQQNQDRVLLSEDVQHELRRRDGQTCPQPNGTMFTTPAPITSTPVATTTNLPTSSNPSSSASPSVDSTAATSSSSAPEFEQQQEDEEFLTEFSQMHTTQDDPFASYMQTLHHYMSRSSSVCDNRISDLNSLSEDQLFGFFATLATSQPGPFCSLCHRFATEVHQRVLTPSRLLLTDEEYHLAQLLTSQVPTPKALCSAIAPACYDNYDATVRNLTTSVICMECSGCMAVTNVIQHKFLLQPTAVQSVLKFLKASVFHNICAELCLAMQETNNTFFPNGFNYDACQGWMENRYFLELQWCELNEQPNALHCLKELCVEYFKDTPQTRWLCSQIPDSPQQADQYLNIKNSKKYKDKKQYHVEFEKSYGSHDEL